MISFYCAKAIYLGEEGFGHALGPSTLQLDLAPTAASLPNTTLPLSNTEVLDLQNRPLAYRLKNQAKVAASSFDAPNFSSHIQAVARVLGASIVDEPELQADIIDLLGRG